MARKPAAKKTTAKKRTTKKSKYKFIIVSRGKGACHIQLNRPEKMNAMNVEMAEEIIVALTKAETDRRVTAIIFSGNERSFCAGADLGRMGSKPNEQFDQYRERFNISPNRQLYRMLCFYTKPVISAVEGYCLGGGFEITMWGDMIVAGEGASFGMPEVLRGLIPGAGGTQNLPRLIGPALAKEMIWTGRRITAVEAEEKRIVNHVVAKGSALKKAQEIVAIMAKNGPLGIMMSKQAINRGLDQSRYNGYLGEGDLAHMLNFSDDKQEGLQAFAERRPAKFKGE